MISSSYLDLPKRGKFRGYIVNVYDPVNYDIDLYFDDITENIYKDVFKSYYTSISLDAINIEDRLPQQRSAYRCRVKGISMQRSEHTEFLVHKATNEIKNKIFLFNGWVDCYIGDIDYYNRILVELFDPLTGQSITSELFNNPTYKEIFSPYTKKRNYD